MSSFRTCSTVEEIGLSLRNTVKIEESIFTIVADPLRANRLTSHFHPARRLHRRFLHKEIQLEHEEAC